LNAIIDASTFHTHILTPEEDRCVASLSSESA
jgi:hypothetical protein